MRCGNTTRPVLKRAEEGFFEKYGFCHPLSPIPRKTNFIGEHTDHNEGFVLPVALPFDTVYCCKPGGGVAGCAIALVSSEAVDRFCSEVASAFAALLSQPAENPTRVYPVRASAGASLI